MKQSKILFLLFIVTILLSPSCNTMDTKPFESYSDDVVWGSKSTADAFVDGTISAIMGGYINGNQTAWEERTNNAVHSNGGNGIVRETINREDGVGGLGNFENIRRCNLIIKKAEEYNGKGLLENDSKELIAKGKLLRALLYYQQARTMGRFVWVDKVLSSSDAVGEGLKLPTTRNTTESYTYILADLDAAIPDLPITGKSGELTQNVAYAFKSEIALQAAAYETNNELKTKWLKESIGAANEIIKSGQHRLADDFGDMFNEKDRYSSEIIFAIYRDKSNTTTEAISPLQNVMPNITNDDLQRNDCSPLFKTNGGQPFIGWLWWTPTQNLVDAFEVIDDATGKTAKWNETSQFKNNVQVSNSAPSWVTDGEKGEVLFSGTTTNNVTINDLIYLKRDARFYGSIIYDGCEWWDEDIWTTVKGNLWRKSRGGLGPHMGLTNYYWRKGVYNVEPRVYAGTNTDYHFVVTRLGRVLLNKAEAILWLAGMGVGNVSDAIVICNETRTQHGKLSASTASTLEEAWKLYLTERRCELAMENDFYWSQLRWGKHGGYANNGVQPGGKIKEMTVSPTYIEITKDRKSFYVGKVTWGSNDDRKFDESRRYLFPIPQGQINRNENLGPQNLGW